MSFNSSLVASGLQPSQIVSDGKHSGSFLCLVCSNLISLDSVVTTTCNHPFCRKCLEQTAMEAFVSQGDCKCPACPTDLTSKDVSGLCMQVGSLQISARPLAQAQPLAYKVLGLVQVTCVEGSCGWSGNYSEYLKHMMAHSSTASKKEVRGRTCVPRSRSGSVNSEDDVSAKRLSRDRTTVEKPNVHDFTDRSDDEMRNKGAYPGSNLVPSESSSPPLGQDANSDLNSSISSNMGFWDFDEHDHSDMLDSPSKIPTRVAPGSSNLELGRQVSCPDDESISQFDESFSDMHKQDEIDHLKRLVLKAEKYKKQANARFNKNEFSAARSLYSKGIKLLSNAELETESQRDLLAHMYSNRAVAYFRNKQFDDCILDCDMAIQHQPMNEKPWIRKWRALMAKGDFDEAFSFISKATKSLPRSERIHKDYKHCKKEKEVLTKVRGFMNKGDVVNARSTLEREVKDDCDNIVLFVYSARLSITVGALEEALEKINKALRFNPDYVDALESRGFLYFFQGDMEKASTFLYDAHVRHKSHDNLKVAKDRVKQTKELYEKANDLVEQKDYKKSVELFTQAIDTSSPMPPLAPMFAIMRTHRAESFVSMKQYVAALKDCQEVLKYQSRFAPAWVVRAKVMCALGKAEQAKKEILSARKTWGANDPDIEKGLKYVEFELRVSKEDSNMEAFKSELDAGDRTRIMTRRGSVRTLGSQQVSKPKVSQQNSFVDPISLQERGSSQNVLATQKSAVVAKRDKQSSFAYSMSDLSDFCAGDVSQDNSRVKKSVRKEISSSRSFDADRGRKAPTTTGNKTGEERKPGRSRRRSSLTNGQG